MNSEKNFTNFIEDKENKFFFDTYALYEIVKGSENYKSYTSANIITAKLNIFELYFVILKDINEENAKKALSKYYGFVIDFDNEVIEKAAKLKKEQNRRELSMTDCIGYNIALQLGMKFLTGDEQFKNFPNVEFVK